jgi:MFS family permease
MGKIEQEKVAGNTIDQRTQSAVQSSNHPAPPEKTRLAAWIYSILPYSIAYGPVSTLIPLFILNLQGTVIDVSLAITTFNAVVVPAAIFSGFITDRFHKRKPIIMLSYLTVSVMLVLLLFARTVYSISFLYALFALATTASTTPLNLLIMETESKPRWATAFARLQMVSVTGVTVGLLFSLTWSIFLPLNYMVIALAILSSFSAILAFMVIKEPSVAFEQQVITMTKTSFFHRLQQVPLMFLRIPKLSDFKRVFRTVHYDLTQQIPLLYLSIFAFYVASGLFNTSFVPSLQANSISSMFILLVTTVTYVAQIISFRYAGPYVEKLSPKKAAVGGLILRSTMFGLLGVSALLLSGTWFLVTILIFYPVAAGLAFSIYYTSSNTMVFNTLGRSNQGSMLGVYSAIVGIATMSGSLASGFTSFYLGYHVTFIMAAGWLAISAVLLSMSGHQTANVVF